MTVVDFTSDSSQLETKFAIFVAIMIIIIITCMGIPLIYWLKNYLDKNRKKASGDDNKYQKKHKV